MLVVFVIDPAFAFVVIVLRAALDVLDARVILLVLAAFCFCCSGCLGCSGCYCCSGSCSTGAECMTGSGLAAQKRWTSAGNMRWMCWWPDMHESRQLGSLVAVLCESDFFGALVFIF